MPKVKLPFKRESTVPVPPEVGATASGTLPDALLVGCGVRSFRMTADAARSLRAMSAAAAIDGVRLDATGTYRSLEGQMQLFLSRYQPCTKAEFELAKARKQAKMWPGAIADGQPSVFWRKIVSEGGKVPADAATPGASTHGIGVSVDLARTDPTNPSGPPLSLDTPTLSWLAADGERFGMWNTSTSECWHFSHFGPGVTPAVLEVEERSGLDPLSATDVVADRTAGRRGDAGGGAGLAALTGAAGLMGLAAVVERVKARTLFLGNPAGNDPEAVRWLRIRLNVALHLTGTSFQLDEASDTFDADLDTFVVAFQEHIKKFVEGLSGGTNTFAVDHRVGPDTWFWLFS